MRQKQRKCVYLDKNREHYMWSEIVKLMCNDAIPLTTLTQKELAQSIQVESDDTVYYIVAENEDTSIGEDLTPVKTIIERQAKDELESMSEDGHLEFALRWCKKDNGGAA